MLPALVELDPYSLRLKDQNSYWEIATDDTAPFGSGWDLDVANTPEGLLVYFLLSPTDSSSPSSIFSLNPATRVLTRVLDLGVRASGLAYHNGSFYFSASRTVGRVDGASITLPDDIAGYAWGLDYVADPSGDYLLAIMRSFSPGKVYKISLSNGEPTGAPVLLHTLNAPSGSPLQAHQFAGAARATVVWEDGVERDVLYVTKDDYLTLPCDAVAIVDATTGGILKVVRAKESSIALDAPILWPSGVASNALNWSSPQGIKYVDGRLFVMTRYYWNKGPSRPSCYGYSFKAYINGEEAKTSSAAVTVMEGDQVRLTYEVKNTGFYPVTLTKLTDSTGADLSAACSLPKAIAAGETFACETARAVQGALEGAALMGKAQVGCLPDELAPVWYKTIPRPTTTTVTASATAVPGWARTITYDWALTDAAGSTSLTIDRGKSSSIAYTLTATRSVASQADRYTLSGQVCVTNPGALPTEGLKIVYQPQYRIGSGAFADLPGSRVVVAPAEQLSAGASSCYPYAAEFLPVIQATYRVLASVTIGNYDGHAGVEYGPDAIASFTLPTTPLTAEIDGAARLTHVVTCPSGFSCTTDNAGPWDLSGSRAIAVIASVQNASGACDGVVAVASGATLVEGTSGDARTASAKTTVTSGACTLAGCTRGHGYWKTHPEAVEPLLLVVLGSGAGSKSVTVDSTSKAVDVLGMSSYGTPSNGITKLYAQLLAAKLNMKSGADGSSVAVIIQAADAFLATHDYTSWSRLSAAVRSDILGWMEALDAYNSGKTGPGLCTETATVATAKASAAVPATVSSGVASSKKTATTQAAMAKAKAAANKASR